MVTEAPSFQQFEATIELLGKTGGIILLSAHSRPLLHEFLTSVRDLTNGANSDPGMSPVLNVPEHLTDDRVDLLPAMRHLLRDTVRAVNTYGIESQVLSTVNAFRVYGVRVVCLFKDGKAPAKLLTTLVRLREAAGESDYPLVIVLATTEAPAELMKREPGLLYEASAFEVEPLSDTLVKCLIIANRFSEPPESEVSSLVAAIATGNYGRLMKLLRLYEARFGSRHLQKHQVTVLRQALGW